MKIKIKRVSNQALSIILAIMMLVSTMLIGTISVVAADTATIYFDNSKTNWENVYITFYGSEGYWTDGKGTGAENKITKQMTPVEGKANWFKYEGTDVSSSNLSFHSEEQSGYGNFHGKGEVIYITNYSDSTPYYTPDTAYNTMLNENTVKYYSTKDKQTGTWTANYPGGDEPDPTPDVKYYLFYYDNSSKSNIPVEMEAKDNGTYVITTNSTYLNNDRKFKIANSNADGAQDKAENCVNYNIGQNNISMSDSLTAASVTVTHTGGTYNDIQITNTSDYNFVIEYTPAGDNGLTGNIKVWSVDDYNNQTPTGLAKPKLKGDSSVLPGSEVTVSLDNQKYYYNNDPDTDPEYKTSGVLDGLSFEFDVTASDDSNVAVTPGSCNKFVNTDGTPLDSIMDKITFTASSTEGVTYTVKVTVSATGYDYVVSENFTVTTTSNSIKSENRIYAYAVALENGTKPTAPDAWVAAEKNAPAQAVYKNKDAGNTYPSLGSTSETDLRIFLPSTASKEKVTLYNAFNSEIEVNSQPIPANSYATITYTPGTTMTVTGATPTALTIYTSDAQGAVYLNNTGAYPGYYDNGVPKMIEQLYTHKDNGEIGKGMGNTGAISDSKGTRSASVKKVKGRGNSTWDYTDKKSFNVTYSKAVEIAGVKAEKFSFLANFKDPSLSRNKILYELADKMGVSYSPDTATVDLYMNGLYMGSYLACQKVDVGADNLIKDVAEVDLTTNPTNFDFVMELDTKPAADDYAIKLAENRYLTMKSPELPSAEFDHLAADTFIKGRYEALLYALNDTSKTALADIIDIDSLAKFYLLNELAKNYDIGVASTYFVYKASEGKFYASPIWDLDMAASNGKNTNDAVDKNFRDYEGNWTNINNSDYNVLMRAAFNNVNVQAAARSIWTRDYYTELTGYLNGLQKKAHDVNVSLENNNKKWTQPYGFEGEFHDNLYQDDNTKLITASYDVTTGNYTKNAESTYGSDAKGQIDFVVDWLKSRAAWMTQKYNKYYITGLGYWGDTSRTMTNNKNGINTYEAQLNAGTHTFKISSDGGAETYRSATAYSISFSPDMATNYVSKSTKITDVSVTNDDNKNFQFKISENMTVYITYDQKTNTVTLSDQLSTTTNPAVTLNGSNVDNENIVEGTPVTLTATVTPAMKDNAVLGGTYTVELLRDGTKLETNKVIFETSDLNKTVEFSTKLAGKSQKYTVKVSHIDAEGNTLTGESNSVEYRQTGLKDKKIYFDPSSIYDGNNQVWKSQMTPESTVTAYIKNSDGTTTLSSFTMSVDSEDMHGYDKGVFVANIDDDTLALLQNSANSVVFKMVGQDGTTYSTDAGHHEITINGDPRIRSGWIYNYSNESNEGNEQWKWEEYNVDYVEEYPHPERIKTYDDFKKYLIAQSETNTDNIVYFDNSASKWYNVYIYGWDGALGNDHDNDYGYLMKKLPYADIWYYDFGATKPTSNFLFKDRGDYGFGSDYQQTVDLSGENFNTDYILNGYGEKVYLNFKSTINTPNPIFVTNNFYKSTQQNVTDVSSGLKFRAFNTEWQEFAEVVTSDVQTKAVNVFFDLHSDTADDILIYHTSKTDKFTFPSEFVRLTKLPDSTIYHASLLLPYSQKNGCEFKFTKFRVNGKDYAMGAASQPKDTCISTGEVWYEVNSNYKNGVSGNSLDAQSADYSIVPNKTAVDSSSLVGAYNSDAPVAANTITVYFAPENSSNIWENNSNDFTNRTYKCNVQGGSQDSNSWWKVDMEDTKKTINGKKVYSASISYNDTGLNSMQFQKLYNDTFENQVVAFKDSWKTTEQISGKYWNGSEFVDPTNLWESEAESSYYVVGDSNFCTLAGISDAWAKNDATLMDGSGTTYTKSFTNNTSNSLNVGVKVIKVTGDNTVWYPNGEGNEIKIDVPAGATLTVTFDSSAGTFNSDNLSVYQTSHTITNNATGVTANTAASVGTIVTITPTDSSKKITAATVSGVTDIYYYDDGTATFVMPDSDVTINSVTLVDKVVTPTVEYCAVLSYNHSTATFASQEGGQITDAYVNLTNGNYQSDAIRTGYKTSENGTYTVIYALPLASSGATTSNVSTVNKIDEALNFAGWTRDSQAFGQDEYTMEDKVIGASVTNYLANFDTRPQQTYTFNYNYKAYNYKESGIEYNPDAVLEDKTYSVSVIFYADATEDELLAAYKANQPTLESDYFTYTFDNVTSLTRNGAIVSAMADRTERQYIVSWGDADGNYATGSNKYYYQKIATVSIAENAAKPEGTKTVWKDDKGNVIYIGDSYRFRVTKDVSLEYSFEKDASITLSTYVNEPTYEFFTSGNTEKVRFNILVDNFIGDKNVTEYGVVYFFTDKDGKPVNEAVARDENISADMIRGLMTADNSPVKTYKFPMKLVNSDKKYIFASTLTNNTTNRDRYLRVFSYFKYEENGGEIIVVSEKSVLASISKA